MINLPSYVRKCPFGWGTCRVSTRRVSSRLVLSCVTLVACFVFLCWLVSCVWRCLASFFVLNGGWSPIGLSAQCHICLEDHFSF